MKKRAFTVTEYSLTAHCSPSGTHCEARRAESRCCARAGGAEPICAALISDTHGRIIDDLAEAAAEAAPDLILVPGDAIENKRPGHPDGVRMRSHLFSSPSATTSGRSAASRPTVLQRRGYTASTCRQSAFRCAAHSYA